MNNEVTILISSCDRYEDAWSPFVQLLRKQWPSCDYPIVLSTEYAHCGIDGVTTINLPKDDQEEYSWSERLRLAIQEIQSDYILWFLEDFFLTSPVNTDGFEKGLSILKNQPDVGLIHYTPVEKNMPVPGNDLEHCYYELPIRRRTLRTRVCVSLFRKSYFLRLLYGKESPWKYERESHIRSMFAGYKIYRQNYSLYPPTFSYSLNHDMGIGITAGKWLPNNQKLFEDNGIYDVDYNRLGVHKQSTKEGMKISQSTERGMREILYEKVTHPIKVRVRHWWWLQDLLNLKKYFKYYKYYKNLRDQ